ncbi:MAG TPA: hypothetical protein VMV43_01195 [Candidatus Nanopelagicaceae bacterium]|nr:hypothetical protein [Candidatus Nanopelagicaceae bacterium]
MSRSYKDFLDKYKIDDFKTNLKLSGSTKIDFYNDIDKLLKTMSTIFDKLAMIAPMRGAQVLMAVAKLTGPDNVVNKTDIKRCLNIDRLEKILSAIDYLEDAKYITIEKKTEKFHIIKLNEEDNPDLIIFREIIQKYWKSPQEEVEQANKWRDEK